MVNPVYVNPIFAVALLATAQFKFDAETFTATAESPLFKAKLYCCKTIDRSTYNDSEYSVMLDFTSGNKRVLRGHTLAGFDTENDARAFLQSFIELQNARA